MPAVHPQEYLNLDQLPQCFLRPFLRPGQVLDLPQTYPIVYRVVNHAERLVDEGFGLSVPLVLPVDFHTGDQLLVRVNYFGVDEIKLYIAAGQIDRNTHLALFYQVFTDHISGKLSLSLAYFDDDLALELDQTYKYYDTPERNSIILGWKISLIVPRRFTPD